MIRTLRFRLLVSHVLPILLLIPLVGLALIYLLEVNLLLPSLVSEMTDQGTLIAQLAQENPKIWTDPTQASKFLDQIKLKEPTRLALLSPSYTLLAINRPESSQAIGMTVSGLPNSASTPEAVRSRITPGFFSSQPVVDVLYPVDNSSGQLLGYVRLYRRLEDVAQGLQQSRLLIAGVLLVGLLISSVIALILGEMMSRAINQVTRAISQAPLTGEAAPIPESGVTEIHALIQAFNRLQAKRYDLESSRQLMMANLIHELGRPLGSLQAALHALLKGADENAPLRRDLLEGMAVRVERMARLVEDLAESHIQSSGYFKLNRTSLAPNPWIEKMIPLWEEVAREHGIQWTSEISPDLPHIFADEDRLSEALDNLVNNAFKFTPEGGKVTLVACVENSSLCFRVTDTGLGISPEDQQKIFEPFYRSVRPSWKAPGLGLGLSITRSIVRAHGGHIELQSEPGQGSVFSIYFPFIHS
ncbi:MAG: HAMP domain-containing histidine kinase [Chloroflexi bacterium]|nr:HAMP domain-containing histidine kinase [Chloroflexota bacterium]